MNPYLVSRLNLPRKTLLNIYIGLIILFRVEEFVQQLRSGEADDFVHYFLCLVKCSGQVIPTQMVSTLEGLEGRTLDFPNLINLTDLNKAIFQNNFQS